MAILALNALPAQSQIAGYDKRLRRRAQLRDIYVNRKGLFSGASNEASIPNAAYFDVADVALTGTVSATITMKLPLVGLPVTGNTRFDNTEEAPLTKSATIYRNNYGKTVRVETYGTRALEQEPYGLYKEHINDLGDWAAQYEGMEIRMALCQVFSWNLRFGDTAATCGANINPNVMLPNLSLANQPAFSTNLATYTNNIVTGIIASGGLAPTNAQAASFRLFNNIALYALQRMIMPLSIGGKDAFIFVVSPLFASIYADPTWAGSGGAQFIQFTNLNKEVQNWYGVHGVFHSSIGVDIYIVVDPKHPTVLPSGSAAPYSLNFGYVWPGDVDLRNLANPNTRDVNVFLGKGAVAKWEPEKLHLIKQDDNYFKIMGHGIAGVRGISLPRFDQQAPVPGSLEYYGSMLVITARPAYL